MSKRLVIICVVLMLALSGCAPASQNMSTSFEGPAAAPAMPEMADSDSYRAGTTYEVPVEAPAPGDAGADIVRIVIRNANLTIVVDDPSQSMTTIARMAETMGGYVVASNLYKTTSESGREFPEANITIRVPADKLNEAMDQIKALVRDPINDVRSENVSGQDVTQEYTDLQSRLRNLEDTEAQLREIMASANKTEDVLAVYNQLTQIREQIEVIKGQIKYFDEASSLSSIAVILQAQAAMQPLEIGGWQPVGIARNAIQALIDGLQFLASAAIWLILFALPIGLLIYLPLRLVWVLIRRARKNRKPNPPAPIVPPAQ